MLLATYGKETLMKRNNNIVKRTIPMLLMSFLLVSGIALTPAPVHAAGWLDYTQSLTLGNTVNGSIKSGDYNGPLEDKSSKYYWHVYRFAMPKDGLLHFYMESASKTYFSSNSGSYAIFSASNPDDRIWYYNANDINEQFSSSRAMYYYQTEISLNQGEYYFAIRKYSVNNTPYYLTLSYKEPTINVTSIALNPSRLTLEAGEQRNVTATVLPNNATDKTVIWKSNNPSVATVDNGTVTAVSNGSAAITASSVDGEISATCAVTVSCNHNYRTSVSPATENSNGSTVEACTKCGDRKSQTIYRINSVNLSKTTYTYNGKIRKPSVSVIDGLGNALKNGQDYTVSYPDVSAQAGIYHVNVEFMGNYRGTVRKQFKIFPKSTGFTKVVPKKKSVALKWKKTTADCGYEIAYSTSKKFTKKSSRIVSIGKSGTVSKTISRLKPKQRYYVRIRTYKNVELNGKTTKLYSTWSKAKKVTTKK